MMRAGGNSSGHVMRSVGSEKYCPGSGTASPPVAKWLLPSIYGICPALSCPCPRNDAKVSNFLDFLREKADCHKRSAMKYDDFASIVHGRGAEQATAREETGLAS